MTGQGTAHGRFQRAIQRRNLFQAELAIREMGTLSLLDALDCLDLLSEANSAKLERAALRWHGRLETEAQTLTLAESQLTLAAVASLCARERDALKILRGVLRTSEADATTSNVLAPFEGLTGQAARALISRRDR